MTVILSDIYIYLSQLGSQEQMQLFPGQWGMRLKADVQM